MHLHARTTHTHTHTHTEIEDTSTETGGGNTNTINEAGATDQADHAGNADRVLKLYQWQNKVFILVQNASGDRSIIWIYSIKGGFGKSFFATFLVNEFGALVINATSGVATKDLIAKEKKENDLFAKKPVIVVDLPRAASNEARRGKIYQVLESIKGSFHSTEGKG